MLTEDNIEENEIHLRDYVRVVLRRKWIVIAFTVVLVAIVAIYSFKTVPIYESSAQILIDKENPNVVSFEEVMSLDSVDTLFYQTQQKILASRMLARRVINTMNLKESPEFKPDNTKKGFLASLISSIRPESKTDNADQVREESRLVSTYLSKLKIEAIRNSRLVNVKFVGTHPDIITKIANQHAREYIEKNLEMRFAASQNAVEWLRKQLLQMKKKVGKAENALQLYKEKQQIVSLEDRQNIIVQKLEELNTAVTNARTARIELETLYNQTRGFVGNQEMIESIPNVMKNKLIQELKRDYIRMQSEIIKISDKYGERHPTMIKLISQAEEQKKRIKVEIDKVVLSIKSEYQVAMAKEESLSDALEEQKETALGLNRKAIAYGTLKRDADSEMAMYDVLLKRMKETDVTGALKTSNISVIDHAEVPMSPIKPKKKLNIILALVVGLTMGIGMAFLLEYLDNTIKSSEDVENYLGVPLLGLLEEVKMTDENNSVYKEAIVHGDPRSSFAENIRNIRTNIMFASTDNPRKMISVSSTSQGEGKSLIAANLAIAFAQAGKKTLLVDADFRRPRINKIFDVTMCPGLSNHLVAECEIESIIKSTEIPGLSIISCGVIPPDPSEMLGSSRMIEFCKEMRDKFDTIIFDTPPALSITDTIVLSSMVDALVYVIRSGHTIKDAAKRSLLQFTSKNYEVLGVVMNYVNVAKDGYYYQYYSRYYRYELDDEKDPKSVVDTV